MFYTVNDFPFEIIQDFKILKRRRGNPAREKINYRYLDVITAFDIETTNDLEVQQAYMYIWQYQFGAHTIIGRTWEEWIRMLFSIKEQLPADVKVVIFVHNLSFEFQFLRGIYHFDNEEVFAVESRKVLKCEMFETFEYRCSYMLTNMSLDQFTKKMGVENVKLSGEDFDYKKMRYPWTELTDLELQYCINDVKGLVQALRIQMETDGDNLYTLPLTSTGYVRRDVRKAMRSYNKQDLKDQLPDYEVFKMLREAFRGGNTHANRYYSDQIIPNVTSYDRVSSYPDVQLNHRFPLSHWLREDPDRLDLDRVLRKMDKHKRACLMRVAITDLHLTDPMWGCPYIAKAKCRNVKYPDIDNGRILSAEYLETTLTDIDLRILLDEYSFSDITFIDFYHARYGLLPKQLRSTVQKYFEDKTKLKGVDGQEIYYMKVKNKLNSIYGMSVQSPVKQSIDFENHLDEKNKTGYIEREDPEIDLLEESNRKAFQNYAWGVWTTAWARMELEKAIKLCGNQLVYCDTDSVKYIGEVDFTGYNEDHMAISRENGAVAVDPAGNEHYLGVYELDGVYRNFVTLGAKKYAYEYSDGSIGITVAGVNKSKGAIELKNAGGLKQFKEGFVFRDAGGTESIYNDIEFQPDPNKLQKLIREGNEILITSNVVIADSEYTLGIIGEYRRLLERCEIWRDNFILTE